MLDTDPVKDEDLSDQDLLDRLGDVLDKGDKR